MVNFQFLANIEINTRQEIKDAKKGIVACCPPEAISKDIKNNAYKARGEQPVEGCQASKVL